MKPTAFPQVNEFLQLLLSEVQNILADRFVGLYLYGSLALGDFNPDKSDIDFLCAVTEEVSADQFQALRAMHARMGAGGSKWGEELEGSYIPCDALFRYDPAVTRHPHIDRRHELVIDQHDTDWIIQRYVTREFGVVLAGPDPKTLIAPISADELRQAVLDLMWWWELQLVDTHRVARSGYQAYTVLSMCRILYTLQTGAIASKPAAARWALQNLDSHWHALVKLARDWRPGEEMHNLEETLALIRYTLANAKQV